VTSAPRTTEATRDAKTPANVTIPLPNGIHSHGRL
jgi:hypothetical protein